MKRSFLKANARAHLSGKYGDALGVAVLASLVASAVTILASLVSSLGLPASQAFLYNGLAGDQVDPLVLLDIAREYLDLILEQTWLIALLVLISLVIRPLYRLLVGYTIRVGRDRWYLRAAHPDVPPPVSMLFSPFRRGEYGKIMGGMFYRDLWLLFWSIPAYLTLALGILPYQIVAYVALTHRLPLTEGLIFRVARQTGLPIFFFSPAFLFLTFFAFALFTFFYIRKRYRYRMVPYLLADNPGLGARRALGLSKAMTRGKTGGLFMLDLSFLGWILLCLMCICLPWVTLQLLAPYYRMTWAEAYKALRDDAAARGLVRMEDLGYLRLIREGT